MKTLLAVLFGFIFLAGCGHSSGSYNDRLVREFEKVENRLDVVTGQEFRSNKTAQMAFDDFKEQLEKCLQMVDKIELDGSKETEDFRVGFLDILEFYEEECEGTLLQLTEYNSTRTGDLTPVDRETMDLMLREFQEQRMEKYKALQELQKIYAEKKKLELK